MKRLAIVSSYDEECGAAFYSSRLLKHFRAAGFDVDVKRLPVSLLRMRRPLKIVSKGDEAIRRMAAEIADYDAVLLQFEPGLYGTGVRSSYRRVTALLKAAKQAVITVHGFDRAVSGFTVVEAAKAVGSGLVLDGLNEFRNVLFGNGTSNSVTSFWNYVREAKHVHTLTFCKADQTFLERYYDLKRVNNYPITYFDKGEVEKIRSSVDRDTFMKQFGLDPRRKHFAVCGFLSPYKGHLTAIKALEYLPDDWNLVILGGEHPHGLEAGKDIGNYVRQLLAFSTEHEPNYSQLSPGENYPSAVNDRLSPGLLNRIEIRKEMFKKSEFRFFMPKAELQDRVKFLGQVSDEDMPKFYAALDYFVHPYMKTKSGQSGSGPATLAIEFGTKSLFSNAPVFREMSLYFDGSMKFFNVGNFIELAESLTRYDNFKDEFSRKRESALETYNPSGMVNAYREMLGI